MSASDKKKTATKATPKKVAGQANKGETTAAFNLTLDDLLREGAPSVFLDANILIPEYLRTVFLDLAYAGLMEVHWSKGVLEEVQRNLVDPHGRYRLAPRSVTKMLRDMARAFPRALAHGSEKYDAAFQGRTDPKDQHVAAGALKVSLSTYGGQSVVLVTSNATDLPQWAFEGTQVLMVRPDTFLTCLLHHWRKEVLTTLNKMLVRLKNPPMDQPALLDIMVGAGCHRFAFALAKCWGYEVESTLTRARQRQLPKALQPTAANEKAAKKRKTGARASDPDAP